MTPMVEARTAAPRDTMLAKIICPIMYIDVSTIVLLAVGDKLNGLTEYRMCIEEFNVH